MVGVLLDTNVLVDWLRSQRSSRPNSKEKKYNYQSARELIEKLIIEDVPIYISCHTLKELLQYPNISEQEIERITTMLPKFVEILPTTAQVAVIAGALSRDSVEYRDHHIEDCYIAATAINHKLPLYTRNPGDFKYISHKDLVVEVLIHTRLNN